MYTHLLFLRTHILHACPPYGLYVKVHTSSTQQTTKQIFLPNDFIQAFTDTPLRAYKEGSLLTIQNFIDGTSLYKQLPPKVVSIQENPGFKSVENLVLFSYFSCWLLTERDSGGCKSLVPSIIMC